MEDVFSVAAYVCNRYHEAYGQKIDEMKLHKMLYFAQRESLIQSGQPLFDATFYGWKYGPVLKEMRSAYKDNAFPASVPAEVESRIKPVMDQVFADYAGRDSWSLSRLTHGEICWKRSREGVPKDANSDKAIALDDIRLDADRIRERRQMLDRLGLL